MKKLVIALMFLGLMFGVSYAGADYYDNAVLLKAYNASSGLVENVTSVNGLLSVNQKVALGRNETTQNLASGALNQTTSFSDKCKLLSVMLHADAAITQNVTITFDSKTGAAYDAVLATQALSSNTDFYYSPNGGLQLEDGDEIKVQCTNTGTPAANITSSVLVELN